MKYFNNIVLIFAWVMGVVIAKGFWSTFIACIFPLWAYYLTIEKLLQVNGFI